MTSSSRKRPLRTGYTTGTCAAAAVKGAAMTLLDVSPQSVEVALPLGTAATIHLCESWTKNGTAYCTVIKDAGDDPDVTHGAVIEARCSLIPSRRNRKDGKAPLILKGGEGVGRVTKPGLPVRPGEAAINPVPRRMIRHSLREVLAQYDADASRHRVEATLSVPRGKELARKTFNPRLGIIDGISILGTTGIVKPFSHQAYRETISCALDIASAVECREIIFSTGGLSERLAKAYFSHLREESFIQMGDYVGFSLAQAYEHNVHRITVSAFMGKMSKIAAGCTYTHARSFPLDVKLFISLGKKAGASEKLLKKISRSLTTRGIAEALLQRGEYTIIDALCVRAINELYQMRQYKGSIFLILFSFNGEVLWYGGKEGKIAGIG